MLSYRHAFHAGNHADVLKHWIEVMCLQYMKRKDKPFLYLDTHAGAGLYQLSTNQPQKTTEYLQGVDRLWNASDIPDCFGDYMAILHHFNEATLLHYPGSPAIARQLLRSEDRICLAELHGTDVALLKNNFENDKRLRIIADDGFQQLKALLPPASRRGLILIDPPYERKQDYQLVIKAIQEGLKRFATGTYLIWHPLLDSSYSQGFAEQLKNTVTNRQWLNVQLSVSAKPEGPGMYGSSMFVINPPYTLREQLQQGLPWLNGLLAMDELANYSLECSD